MITTSEEIRNFVYYNMDQSIQPLIYLGFDVIENFAVPFYEDKYFEIIYNHDELDPLEVPDFFRETLCRDLERIIESHRITINTDPAPTLDTLVKLSQCLYRIQYLEDYYQIERIMSTNLPNEYKLAQIVETYGNLNLITTLETVSYVDDVLFEEMQALINIQRYLEEQGSVRDPRRVITATFFAYLADQPSIGGEIFNKGYDINITFKELYELIPMDLQNEIAKIYKEKGPAYAAINILSLFMVCSDTREQPVTAFKEYSEILLPSPDSITTVFTLLVNMYNEFQLHYKTKMKEFIDENNIETRLS